MGIAWPFDGLVRMKALLEMCGDGICSNDPRLFAELTGAAAPLEDMGVDAEQAE